MSDFMFMLSSGSFNMLQIIPMSLLDLSENKRLARLTIALQTVMSVLTLSLPLSVIWRVFRTVTCRFTYFSENSTNIVDNPYVLFRFVRE